MKDKFDIDFDVRVVDRNIRDSKITSKDYQKKLDNLEDLTDLAEPLVIEDDSDEHESEELQSEDTESEDTESEVSGDEGES